MSAQNHLESGGLVTVGNTLTFARLILLPVVIAGIATGHGWIAVGAMAAVLVTDLLDGRIARRLGQAGPFGATLDSTVDFVLIYSLFIAFYASGRLALYQFVVIYIAMLVNLTVQMVAMGGGKAGGVVRTASAKVTGALQYVYLLFLVAREVLPASRAVAAADIVIFLLLAGSILISSSEFLARLKGSYDAGES